MPLFYHPGNESPENFMAIKYGFVSLAYEDFLLQKRRALVKSYDFFKSRFCV